MEQVFSYNKILNRCVSEFSPIVFKGVSVHPVVFHFTPEQGNNPMHLHKHRFAELSWMFQGTMKYEIGAVGQIISQEDKNIIFIPPDTEHRRICQTKPTNILGMLLDLSAMNPEGEAMLASFKEVLMNRDYIIVNSELVALFTAKLFLELNAEANVYHAKINYIIYDFLFNLFDMVFGELLHRSSPHRNMYYDHNVIIVSSKQIIEENLADNNHIKKITKNFNISARHLNRLFVEQTGGSIGQYIIKRKLNAAQKMLHNPIYSVKEVAAALGFQRDAYFCHFFKHYTGITPRQFAKQTEQKLI